MTLRFYAHSKSKRAEALALIDSGATENFMSLQYAKYLHLPIKKLVETRQLFNVNGTPNKSGNLEYYSARRQFPSRFRESEFWESGRAIEI